MIYIFEENSRIFAVSKTLNKCSRYTTNVTKALQSMLLSEPIKVHEFLTYCLSNSTQYTLIKTFSQEEYPEYFI